MCYYLGSNNTYKLVILRVITLIKDESNNTSDYDLLKNHEV